jgi:hypothetical protein
LTIGVGLIVTLNDEDDALQPPLLVVVNVKVTLPAAISATDGKYEPDKLMVSGKKVPVPLDVHIPLLVSPMTFPAKVTLALLAHTTWLLPAIANFGLLNITLVVVTALVQLLRVTVTL